MLPYKMILTSTVVAIAVCTLSQSLASAQTTSSAQTAPSFQEPELMGKVYFLNSDTQALRQLPGEAWKKKAKPGFGKVTTVDIVSGARSSFRVSSKEKIVFIYKPFPDQQGALQNIRVYPFDVKGEERISVVGVTKGRTQQGNENVVRLDAAKFGSSSYALTPPDSHLQPGEYWISVPTSLNDPMITFGVD